MSKGCERNCLPYPIKRFTVSLKPIFLSCLNYKFLYNIVMRLALYMLILINLQSCATINENNNYGFLPKHGMDEDAQDRNNTKYNLMDSSDGSQDPNAYIKVWGATY